MDGTQAVESVVCCEQGPDGPLQDIWTGYAVWLPTDFVVVVVTIMDPPRHVDSTALCT